jgi:hypothetical protein
MTIQFLVFAVLQLLLFFWLLRLWFTTGAIAALVLLIPQFFLFYDNFVVGVGRFVGVSDLLYAISWPRFWVHWVAGVWVVIAAGSILRLAGISWMRPWGAMLPFCLLTVVLVLIELPNFWSIQLYPACADGLVRYTTRIAAGDSCVDATFVVRQRDTPLAIIIANFVVIGAGVVLAVARRFPWVLIGSVGMLLTAGVPALRALRLDNFGEVLILGSLIWAIAHFTRARAAPGASAALA